jgi:LytS/YehU family sensor histidine kinase
MNDISLIVLVVLIFIILVISISLMNEISGRNKLRNEFAKLQSEKDKLQANDLKFQLQPHTLNNILANLKLYSNKLNKGLDSMSETLNYIIYEGKDHYVSVEQEIEFIRTYLNLNELFVKQIDSINFSTVDVDVNSPFYKSYCLPHLISAYFIENAFKHGDKDHPEFLDVKLVLDQNTFSLIVKNRTRSVHHNGKGGIGLENMKNRMNTLLNNKYSIECHLEGDYYFAQLTIQL